MISSQKKFIFVHIPKTAGNAIQNVLIKYSEDQVVCTAPHQDGIERFNLTNQYGLCKHSSLREYHAALGEHEFSRRFKFACVRNPWDRAISFYFSPHRNINTWNREDFVKLLGIDVESIPVRNKSSRLAYRDYYDEELVSLVADHFREDIQIFRYLDTNSRHICAGIAIKLGTY